MNRDEQKQITEFIERTVRDTGVTRSPLDIEADAIIRALFVRNPEAAYRITMLAMGQISELNTYRTRLAETHARMRKGWLARLFERRQSPNRGDPQLPSMRRMPAA